MTIEFMENPENKDKVEAMSFLSDIYKDAYGFRPRNIYNVEVMTLEDINKEISKCAEIVKESIKEDKKCLELDIKAFNKLIIDVIVYGAKDFKTAVNWLFEGYLGDDCDMVDMFDIDGFLYYYGISYSEYGDMVKNTLIKIYKN